MRFARPIQMALLCGIMGLAGGVHEVHAERPAPGFLAADLMEVRPADAEDFATLSVPGQRLTARLERLAYASARKAMLGASSDLTPEERNAMSRLVAELAENKPVITNTSLLYAALQEAVLIDLSRVPASSEKTRFLAKRAELDKVFRTFPNGSELDMIANGEWYGTVLNLGNVFDLQNIATGTVSNQSVLMTFRACETRNALSQEMPDIAKRLAAYWEQAFTMGLIAERPSELRARQQAEQAQRDAEAEVERKAQAQRDEAPKLAATLLSHLMPASQREGGEYYNSYQYGMNLAACVECYLRGRCVGESTPEAWRFLQRGWEDVMLTPPSELFAGITPEAAMNIARWNRLRDVSFGAPRDQMVEVRAALMARFPEDHEFIERFFPEHI